MSSFVKAGFSFLKNFGKGGSKTSPTINKVKPTVNTTELEKKISEATKAVQKAKGSGAKLSQSIFELKNNMPVTFKGTKTKTLSNTELKKKADARIKEKATENKKDGGRIGRKFGGGADKQLSSKQMKIASLAGNKKKIDGPDFKKLRAMKSPISKAVRKA